MLLMFGLGGGIDGFCTQSHHSPKNKQVMSLEEKQPWGR